MDVMSIGRAVEKLVRNGGAAGPDYKIGVETTRKDQSENAIAAKEIYMEALTASFGRDAFAKGLRKSGHAKWRANSSGKGVRNYSPGMREAGPAYAKGVEPYFRGLEGLDLGPPPSRGSPEAYDRSRKVGELLHEIRMAQ